MLRFVTLVLVVAACGDDAPRSPDASSPPPDGEPLGWVPDRRLTDHAGASQTTYNFAHDIVAVGDAVHVVWFDDRDGTSQAYYKRSLDGGTTWDADRRLVTSDDNPRMNPAIAVSGDAVYISWHEMRAGGYVIVVDRSLDGGATWDPPVTLTTTMQSAMTSIAADGDRVQLVWHESSSGATEVARSGSTDRGGTWSAIADHLETMLQDVRARTPHGFGLPHHVEAARWW